MIFEVKKACEGECFS